MPTRSVILEITDDAGATRRVNITASRFVAGRRVTEAPLTRGEEVRLGPYVLRFVAGEDEVSPLTTIAGQIPLTADDPAP
jgi:hypothetical protein